MFDINSRLLITETKLPDDDVFTFRPLGPEV